MFANLPRFKFPFLVLLLSCGDSTGVARIGPPAAIELLSEHTLFTTAGSTSGAAIRVLVKDANGRAVPGATVEFERVRRVYTQNGIEGVEPVSLGTRQTDGAGIAALVPELPTLAWEYDVRARLSTGAAKARGTTVTTASVHFYVRPDVMVSADVVPDTMTITGPVHLRAVLLKGCGRDRFGNCTNDGTTFRSLTETVLGLEHAHGPGLSNSVWVRGLEVGDGAVVATTGPYSDTAFVRVR